MKVSGLSAFTVIHRLYFILQKLKTALILTSPSPAFFPVNVTLIIAHIAILILGREKDQQIF